MEPIYRIDDLRAKVLGLLRERKCSMPRGEIAMALTLPLWAVTTALQSLDEAQQVVDVGGAWMAVDMVQDQSKVWSAI